MKKIKLYESDSAEVEAQRFWVFAVLMGVGGFLGAFTYSIRGGVFMPKPPTSFSLPWLWGGPSGGMPFIFSSP